MIVGAPPPCPKWSAKGKSEAREAIKQYPTLELELGRWALYCEGIAAMRR